MRINPVVQIIGLPYVTLDLRIRELLAERMEHGLSDELEWKLATLIERQRQVERAGWFS